MSGVRTGLVAWLIIVGALLATVSWGAAGALAVLLCGVVARVVVRRHLGADAVRGVLLVLLVAPTVVAWRVLPLLDDPVVALAGTRSVVTAELVASGDPEPRTGRTTGSRRDDDGWTLDAALVRLAVPGEPARAVDLPVRVLTTVDISRVLPGARLTVRARVLPGEPLRGRAVMLVAESATQLAPAPPIQGAAGVVRSALGAAVDGRPPDQAGLLPGLVVGDTSTVPADLDQAMRDSGLAHLTAVSGGNVAVVVLLVLAVTRAVGLRRGRAQLVVVALGVAAYVVLARPQPSVVRAAGMTAVVLLAVLADVRVPPLDALGWSVAALLLLDPFLALSIGFAMSAAATAALLLLARRWARPPPGTGVLTRVRHAVVGVVAVSGAAQVAVAPLVAGIGGGLPVGGLPANLLAAPAVVPATALGLVAAVVGVVAPGVAGLVALPACWSVGWIAVVARSCAAWFGVLPWPDGWGGALTMLAVLLGGAVTVLVARRAGGAVARVALAVLAVGGVVALAPPSGVPLGPAWPPPGWRAVMCDVGQGDAVVLRDGDGSAVVVDTGPDPRAVDRCLTRLGIGRVSILVLTHFHADHVEGMPGVLRGRPVGVAVVSPLAEPAAQAARVRRWLADAGVPERVAAPGDRWRTGDLDLSVVWPTRLLRGEGSDPNNASVTLLADLGGVRALLGGDLEPAAQDAVLTGGLVPDVDVVKVPHHGSAKQAPGWVTAARPELALIGVGADNDYGHPSPATLSAYRAAGALVGRTDLDGDLAVVVGDDGRLGLVRRGR
jgi:competence protein ComEC